MVLTTISFSTCQIIDHTKTFVPYEQFDLAIILMLTALNLADLNSGTNPPQASNQAVLGVLLFASV